MEFHEKLQNLRKERGLTQDELAECLYVSRTAISKWESGRGYPSIDSLKEISRFFSVSIDDLLSTEKLLSIAEKENKSNIQNMCELLLGIVDVCSFLLIVLPLYPNMMEGYVDSVSLWAYEGIAPFFRLIYWILFVVLVMNGFVKILLAQFKIQKGQKFATASSMILSVVAVIFLALTREAYAITIVFLLLVIKGVVLLLMQGAGYAVISIE